MKTSPSNNSNNSVKSMTPEEKPNKTCVQCRGEMDGVILLPIPLWFCWRPECPNYNLVQV